MEETITQRESVVTNPAGSEAVVNRTVEHKSSNQQTIANLIYFVFGALELVLLFRFVLRLMGANPASGFVSFVYGLSRPFVMPFEGIFRRAVNEGIETSSVLEPSTLVAVIVYAVIAWGIVKLIAISSKDPTVG
ncbi:MAG: hypothetical protein QG570_571 [Patescibacteria group bacterium]|nr:hypothetical protein [Patescibacteria group bacterium]